MVNLTDHFALGSGRVKVRSFFSGISKVLELDAVRSRARTLVMVTGGSSHCLHVFNVELESQPNSTCSSQSDVLPAYRVVIRKAASFRHGTLSRL